MYSTGIVAVGHPWLSRHGHGHGHGHGQLLKTDLIHCFLQPFKLHTATPPLHFRVSHLHHCRRRRRPCRYGRLLFSPTMQLQDSSVKMEVDVPASLAYQCYNDRESIPQWMPFISTVKVLQDKPDLSRWTLKYTAFGRDIQFSWLARNLQPIPNKKIHWRSLEGLPNSGAVRFFPKGPSSCLIELTVSYEVPQILVPVASALQPFVQSLLLQGLERFSNFAKGRLPDTTS